MDIQTYLDEYKYMYTYMYIHLYEGFYNAIYATCTSPTKIQLSVSF